MEPYFFGRDSQVFGIFHAATGSIGSKGVLIVPPLFGDYTLSHRVLRQVALRLSDRGFAVMRFDFRGTGNSSGDMIDLTRRDWLNDIEDALSELRTVGAVDRVALLAVRHSTVLIGDILAKNSTIDEAVYWDPPLPNRPLFNIDARDGHRPNCVEFQGFIVGQALVESWNGLGAEVRAGVKRTLVLTAGQNRPSSDPIREVDIDCAWDRADELIYSRELVNALCNAF